MSNVAEQLVSVAEKIPKVYEAGQKSMVDESKVIVRTVVGNPLTVDNVSEIPHEASIQLVKRNMFPSGALSVGNYTKIDNYRCAYPCELPVGNYSFNAEAKESANDIGYFYLQRKSIDGSDDWTSYVQFIMNRAVIVANAFSIEEGYEYRFWSYSGTGVFPLDYFTEIRIEADISLSGVAVDVGGEAVIVDENGCADGIKTVSPTMTLAVDSEFIDIALTYHKSWGMQAEYDAFWDSLQQNGNRTSYRFGFAYVSWNDKTFKPKYDIIPSPYEAINLFCTCNITNLKQILIDCGVIFDVSKVTNALSMFDGSTVTYLPKLDFSSCTSFNAVFNKCTSLISIEELKIGKNTTPNNITFQSCSALENLIVTGTIGKSGFDLHWSTKLTTASLLSVLTALSKDSTVATGKTVTFATASQAVIEGNTDCMTQYNLAIDAGWTIAFNEA